MKTTARCCLLVSALTAWPLSAKTPLIELRQTVIRAPELEVIELLSTAHRTDEEISAQLWKWVRQGDATIVSEVTTAADDREPLSVSSGRRAWIPTESDQDLDRLWLTPAAFEEKLVGTSIECRLTALSPMFFDGRASAEWKTTFALRAPLVVKWPASWLEKAQPIHGWMDWRDTFEESFTGKIWLTNEEPTIVAMLPPADQVWPGKRKGRWLDVFEARLVSADDHNLPKADLANGPTAMSRTTLIGISIDAGKALELSLQRDGAGDEVLLQGLLGEVKSGKAQVRFSTSGAAGLGDALTTVSARQHNYPTEMPSVPSAWDWRAVGTSLVAEAYAGNLVAYSLQHSLTPPGRTTWQLSLDDPSVVMHEPQFRDLKLRSETVLPQNGTRLLGILHVPACMDGNGLSATQTILVFARRDTFPAAGVAPPADPQTVRSYCEAELIVFEVPASEEAQWRASGEDLFHESDRKLFSTLTDRVKAGTSGIVAHLSVMIAKQGHATLAIQEEVMTAMEFDPPQDGAPNCMRPTGLDVIAAGSQWEVELTTPDEAEVHVPQGALRMKQKFTHTTALPVEPTLQSLIDHYRKHGEENYPEALRFVEAWEGEHTLVPGEPLCLGLRTPPGIASPDVRHVAFVRMREVK